MMMLLAIVIREAFDMTLTMNIAPAQAVPELLYFEMYRILQPFQIAYVAIELEKRGTSKRTRLSLV